LQLNVEPAEASLPKVPLGHAVQTLDLAGEYKPAVHATQTVCPLDAVIEPAVHGEHIDEPAEAEYVPAGHCKQEAIEVDARYWLNVPAAQSVQDPCPR
jgi:hypothetical protein